jgi:DNA helicase-2/ATP-dependent DNA helicase PcrA
VLIPDLSLPKPPLAFSQFLETQLNAEQKEAVLHHTGSILVIAGAGSGKTRLITSRILNLLLELHAGPTSIVALTFTNKAAQEMKERVKHFTTSKDQIPFIGTFHSYCLQLLKMYSQFLPFETFSIIDEDDKKAVLTKLLKQSTLHKKLTPQTLSHHISRIKNQLPENNALGELACENPALYEIFKAYEKEKQISKCFDFDDLLLEALNLFRKHPEVKMLHQERVRHLLVDEYQDTNTIQHALLLEMALDKKKHFFIDSICVVGDEDQSIYSWRGATVENIINFKKDFKDARSIKIEQNYRSKQPILSVANHLIKHNSKRNEKKLWSAKQGTDCVRAVRCLSGYQEAEIIGRFCKLLHSQKKLSSTAVLYRTHFQSRVIEEALLRHSIPYTIIGGIRFYERKEIKDILAYLRLIMNPFDRVAFARVINCPLRGLGDKNQEALLDFWETQPLLNFKQMAVRAKELKIISGSKAEALDQFCSLFAKVSSTDKATDAMSEILLRVDYLEYLKKAYEPHEADERNQNIKELLNAAHYFGNQGKGSVKTFLEEVALLQEQINEQSETEKNSVTLMTLHAAKGLEFDNIVITGLEEGLLPSARSLDTVDTLEEERRLLYVGITRSRNRLLFTYARYRQSYGQMEDQIPSRFLEEIPHQFCRFEQADKWQYYEADNYLSQWVGIAPQYGSSEVFVFSTPRPATPAAGHTTSSATKPVAKEASYLPKASNFPVKEKEKPSTSAGVSSLGGFKKHQTVKHETFGLGVIKNLEERKGKLFAEVQFKVGAKKIETSFLSTP